MKIYWAYQVTTFTHHIVFLHSLSLSMIHILDDKQVI